MHSRILRRCDHQLPVGGSKTPSLRVPSGRPRPRHRRPLVDHERGNYRGMALKREEIETLNRVTSVFPSPPPKFATVCANEKLFVVLCFKIFVLYCHGPCTELTLSLPTVIQSLNRKPSEGRKIFDITKVYYKHIVYSLPSGVIVNDCHLNVFHSVPVVVY